MSKIVWVIIAFGIFYLFYGAKVFSPRWHLDQVKRMARNEPTFSSLVTITLALVIAFVLVTYARTVFG
ncbi:hypothetical protein [Roseitalea porphyridii]|uniref:Uncharacterized protein n=1 Tax=Roseitalea porphyridii TaxID=1852022 RepID=A0A4P6V478_9HYPH|nr:hypothetical protein [Roseitalea porphyridii]QBK32075.1 hypothetical protein E0E05_16685 [Roseitalea porphyridii]